MLRNGKYHYLHLDVFTDRPLAGNQLAVFLDAQGLDADVMQRIALEMAFSETTFVFPAEHPTTDYRVRIFTPRTEIPMGVIPRLARLSRSHMQVALQKRRLPSCSAWVSVALPWAWN